MIEEKTRVPNRPHRLVRFELISASGEIFGPYHSAEAAAEAARAKWPDQEQDEDRTGKGWDIQVVGCDR